MKNVWLKLLMILFTTAPCTLLAQHLELGGFGSYQTYDRAGLPAQAWGMGGRASINLHPHVQFELETSYDFKNAQFRLSPTTSTVTLTRSKMGVLHGNLGLKFQTTGGSFFAFVKGGANRFDTEFATASSTGLPTFSTFTTTSSNSFVKGVLYPGAGVGFHAGPIGLRLDLGDEIYWDNGARHNLRVTFGPTLRF